MQLAPYAPAGTAGRPGVIRDPELDACLAEAERDRSRLTVAFREIRCGDLRHAPTFDGLQAYRRRVAAGLSRADVVAALDALDGEPVAVTVGDLRRWERGPAVPPFDVVAGLGRVLQAGIAELCVCTRCARAAAGFGGPAARFRVDADRLREARRAAGLSVLAAVSAAGATRRDAVALERGRGSAVTFGPVHRYASVLGLAVAEVLVPAVPLWIVASSGAGRGGMPGGRL